MRGRSRAGKGDSEGAVSDWIRGMEKEPCLSTKVYFHLDSVSSDRGGFEKTVFGAAMRCLKSLRTVSGDSVQCLGCAGEFYIISGILRERLKDEDFVRMTESGNPILRLTGLVCLGKSDIDRYGTMIQSFSDDPEEINFFPIGSSVYRVTVGKIVGMILRNPNFLEYAEYTDADFVDLQTDLETAIHAIPTW